MDDLAEVSAGIQGILNDLGKRVDVPQRTDFVTATRMQIVDRASLSSELIGNSVGFCQ